MDLYGATVGSIQENCYFLVGDNNRETLIFDPGAEPETLKNIVKEHDLNPIAIVLTHAHYDHIGALNDIRDTYDIPVYQHIIEKEWLVDPAQNGSGRHPEIEDVISTKPADVHLEEMGNYSIGEFTFEMQHVPGHSPGSTIFIFKDHGFAIVGDVIFKGSVGRTDFPYGSHETLIDGIRKYIMPLPGDTVLFPGHGDATTVQEEIDTNPFLNGATR
ncbi:MBL fold metallo-hydrolase [Desemzia sp. FAM 23991]|uniref:MBL fold metallo-hydrolase n=1 Tax=unclassified Desemzia TaxID=2685243 RepID=UPI0038855705